MISKLTAFLAIAFCATSSDEPAMNRKGLFSSGELLKRGTGETTGISSPRV